ncbi:hypothetical protein [Halovivax cerinus]|uniref:Uncharacterized protein n=1 Tax=Halovivax cerinus TaxID=1487865 RepID=A0ABD5NPQ0_9EURY|nr:hypothetical protein [Halovivax cerinus]
MTDQSSSRDAGGRGEAPGDGARSDEARDDGASSVDGDGPVGVDGDGTASGLSRCPRCDRPVAVLTICGPMDARVGPCGCRLSVVEVNDLTGSS